MKFHSTSRVWLVGVATGASVGLIALFVFILSLRPAAPTPRPSDLPGPTATPLAQDTLPITQVVADVNGRLVMLDTVETMAHIDGAMADLLGAPSDPDLLDRAVNGELVWQAAQQSGVQPDPTASEQEFNAWLDQTGRTQAELQASLQAHGLDLEAFQTYFVRLQQIERFSTQEAERLGVSPTEYVRQLQRQARISFGPAAAGLANRAAAPISAATQAAAETGTQPAAAPTVQAGAEAAAPAAGVGPQAGLLAPPFELPALNHTAASLALAKLAGKPAALTFFATWCPYCRRQTPLLVEAARKYAGQVQFVGLDVGEGEAQAKGYIEEMGIPYPVALDDSSQVGGLYAVTGFPTTFFIDAQGKVVNVQVGLMSAEALEMQLQQLIASSR